MTPEVQALLDNLLRGPPVTREETSDLLLSRFPDLLLGGSGAIEEIHSEGYAYDEFIRNYVGIVSNLPLPTIDDIYEEVENDVEIDDASGNDPDSDWDPEEVAAHPYAMLDDFSSKDVQVGETVILLPADPDPSGEPLDSVPFPGAGCYWGPGRWKDSVVLRDSKPTERCL